MTNKIIQMLEAEQMSKELPPFAPGDTVIVQVKVKEGERERLQAFEGVVIGKRNRGFKIIMDTVMLLLFILHHIMNPAWLKTLIGAIRPMQVHCYKRFCV